MYSSLLIRPPHKHDKTAKASLCGQDLFLIKGVKRWHCIKNITVSSLIVQTQVFFHDCIMKQWVLITIRINMFSFLGLFFSPTFYKQRKDTRQVLPWTYERVWFLSKMKGCHVYFIDTFWMVNYTFVWHEFHTSWKVRRVHFMIRYTVPTKGNLFLTKLQRVLCLF